MVDAQPFRFAQRLRPILPRSYSEEEPSTENLGPPPPCLEDVISGAATKQPFNLASFMIFAERNLFSEAVMFLTEVNALRRETDLLLFKTKLRHIIREFVSEDAPRQVNLRDEIRQKTEKSAAKVLNRLAKKPKEEPDRTSLDRAYFSVMKLVRDDQYRKYMDFIVAQRKLRLSSLETKRWANKEEAIREFFTFPSQVDAIESRLHAFLTVVLTASAISLSMLLGLPWLWLYLTYGFLARFLCGPRLDLQSLFVQSFLRPLVEKKVTSPKDEFLPGSSMRFAELGGLTLAAGCTVAAFIGQLVVMLGVASVLVVFSGLRAFRDLCVYCVLYRVFVKAAFLWPGSSCKIRNITGKGAAPKTLPEDQVRTTVNPISSRSLGAGDGRRKAMPPLLQEQFSSSASWPWRTWRDIKTSSDKKEDDGEGSNSNPEGEKEEEKEELSQTGSSGRNSLNSFPCPGECGSASQALSGHAVKFEDGLDKDDERRTLHPKPVSKRNALGFSSKETANLSSLSSSAMGSSGSETHNTTKKNVADLEDIVAIFSKRLSESDTTTRKEGRWRTSTSSVESSSRTTKTLYSFRTVSDLDLEKGASNSMEQYVRPSEKLPVDDGYIVGSRNRDDGCVL
ncbi:unnamed protein product [Ectocarpus sp. CCAP 1310/34]|nr:unnamed protein product [Ectocarpus sp. CCAP 1310/34]